MTARETWVYDRQQMKPVLKQFYRAPNESRSDLPAPMIISDTLDYVQNPANGQTYTSKSKYYKAVRDAGCEILGSEKPSASPKPQLDDPVKDIKQAMEQVASGNVPLPSRKRRA